MEVVEADLYAGTGARSSPIARGEKSEEAERDRILESL